MKKNSTIDYLSCILFRALGPCIRVLPLGMSLFLGRRLGELFYYLDIKHKVIAYANIKTVFGTQFSPRELGKLTQDFYRRFGQNLIEIFFIPIVDKEYINKYITLENMNYIDEGFKRGKGVILLGVHVGSWELSNIICANLGFPFSLFVRDQGMPRLNKLLNLYRSQKGCKIIERENETRQLIEDLKSNRAIGMTVDQGGKAGTQVKFFGKSASMPTGAIKLALRYDATLLPAFYTRIKGPYIKIIIDPPFKIQKTGNLEQDIRENLQEVIKIFEKKILKYPAEYLWTYKIWKYGRQRNILIISDGKTGHLRQAQAAADIVRDNLKEKGIDSNIETIEVKFKNKFSRSALIFSSCLSGKYICQGCLWCLKAFLEKNTYEMLVTKNPNVVISCGSSLAPINFVVARENLAKSIVLMRPSILSIKRFDLVIALKHDNLPKRKNVVVTDGALNLINQDYLNASSGSISSTVDINKELVIGLLLGGDTKDFHLNRESLADIIREIKCSLEKLDGQILVTTSRRTSPEIEKLVKEEFLDYPRCKLLIVANEKNIPQAVGGILGLSKIVITSPESISMISEAVSSNRYVFVFASGCLNKRRRMFLENLQEGKYIYLIEAQALGSAIEDVWLSKPMINILKDNQKVKEAIKAIL